MTTILNFLNRLPAGARVIVLFTVTFVSWLTILSGFASFIANPTKLGAYIPHDAGNIKESLIGYDQHNHMTLNSVPLGVPVAVALPACEGDPKVLKVLCHGPLSKGIGDYLEADVYGFDAGKDRDGKPVVKAMSIHTVSLNDMTITQVVGEIATTSALPTIVSTTEALGTPGMSSFLDMKHVDWGEKDGHRLWMTQWLYTDHADMFLVAR
jgi:hypothetical protein